MEADAGAMYANGLAAFDRLKETAMRIKDERDQSRADVAALREALSGCHAVFVSLPAAGNYPQIVSANRAALARTGKGGAG